MTKSRFDYERGESFENKKVLKKWEDFENLRRVGDEVTILKHKIKAKDKKDLTTQASFLV